MKKTIFTSIVCLFSSYFAFSQINIGFETETGNYYSMGRGSDSIWQIVMPTKGRFTSAHSGNFALITDSTNFVAEGKTAIMNFNLVNSGCYNFELYFYHKYYTDSLHSGGFVEVSYDEGVTWINVIYDTIQMDTYLYDFYELSDTITGGYPAFSGTCEEWKCSRISLSRHSMCNQHDSISYRFVYKTDSVAFPYEGWMVDDVAMNIFRCGKINTSLKNEKPCFELINEGNKTYSVIPEEECLIKICSLSGNMVFNKNCKSKEKLTINFYDWQSGYYIITTISKNSSCSRKVKVL